jgi:hypothetical protein
VQPVTAIMILKDTFSGVAYHAIRATFATNAYINTKEKKMFLAERSSSQTPNGYQILKRQ